jgi:GH18 family chitinase
MAGNRHRPEDRANYTLLMTELRRALDDLGRSERKRYLVTIGAGAATEHVRNLDVRALVRVLDFINVMTYDYHSGGATTHFNAPLAAAAGDPTPQLNVRASIDAYIAAGAPPSKLVVGVPFYGYGYAGVDSMQKGRFQSGTSSPPDANPWAGAIRYHRIPEALRSGFTRHWDARAGVPWLYNARTRTWITYDDIESIGLKINLVGTRKLGGIMIWELSGDDGSLLPAIHRRLKR